MKNKKSFSLSFVGFLFVSLIFLFASCGEDSGLGGAVDTKSPTLEITYPPAGVAIRDSFILYGNVSDDKSISKITGSIKSLDKSEGQAGYVEDGFIANVSGDSKTWSVKLNDYDQSNPDYYNGWKYADGKYQVSVTAYDNAGNNSGPRSLSFEIDNTPPVFIISNPGVVKGNGESSPSAYGSVFTIDGTISDSHDISCMDVKIFNESGDCISSESYDGEAIDFYRQDDVPTAGGTSVQIALYSADGTSDLNTRYNQLHPNDSDTEYYYAQISLADSTQVYQNPPNSNARSAEELKEDSSGNVTSDLYLYDDVYTSLMSAKKGINSANGGLSVANLKDIIAGLETGDIAEQALAILKEKVIDTSSEGESDKMANRLSFSLNPAANPSYNVNGFSFGFGSDGIIQTASSGNTVSVTVSAGLDGTNIDPAMVRVWMKELSAKPSDEALVKSDLASLEKTVDAYIREKTSEGESLGFVDALHADSAAPATTMTTNSSENDWLLVYDYSSNNGKSSSVSTKTFSVTLPDGISLGKYYILAVTGYDVEEVVFSQDKVYGFEGNTAGVPPTINFETPNNLSVWNNLESPVFTGTSAISSAMLYVAELCADITVTNENDNSVLGTYSDKITSKLVNDEKSWTFSESKALTYDNSSEKWKLDISKISALADLFKQKSAGGVYWLVTVKVSGKSSSGHEGEASRSIHIDTVAPVLSISSAEPRISDYDSSEYVYLNEGVKIKGNIEEQNLEEVTYDILASDNLSKSLTSADSVLAKLRAKDAKYTGSLGKVFSINKEVDTAAITALFASSGEPDPKVKIDVIITARDSAGNSTVYRASEDSNLTDGKIFAVYQRTDRPKIEIGNASLITDKTKIKEGVNLFGTTNNRNLQLSFSDDDALKGVRVTVYDESGNVVAQGIKSDSDLGKTTFSYNYTLPSAEGKYQVFVEAADYVLTDMNATSANYGYQSLGKFFVAVDSGAPTLSIASPANGAWVSRTEAIPVSGTVSKCLDTSVTGIVYDENNKSVANFTASVASEKVNDSYTWNGSVKLPDDADGNYRLVVTAKDGYEQSSSLTYTMGVDVTAPSLVISNATADSAALVTEKLLTDENSHYTAEKGYLVSGTWEDSQTGTNVLYYSTDLTAALDGSDSKRLSVEGAPQTTGKTSFSFYIPLSESDDFGFKVWAVDGAGNMTEPVEGKTQFSGLKIDLQKPVLKLAYGSPEINIADSDIVKVQSLPFAFTVTFDDTNVPESEDAAFTTKTSSVGSLTLEAFEGETGSTIKKAAFTLEGIADESSAQLELEGSDTHGRKSALRSFTISYDKTAPRISLDEHTSFQSSNSVELTGTVTDPNFEALASSLRLFLVPALESERNDESSGTKTANVTFEKSGSDYKFIANFSGLKDIEYHIAIVAKDSFGNVSYYSTDSDDSDLTKASVSENSAKLSGISIEGLTAGTLTGTISIDSLAPVSTVTLTTSGTVLDRAKAALDSSSSYQLDFGNSYYTNSQFTLGGKITETNLVASAEDAAAVTGTALPKLTVSVNGATSKKVDFTLGNNDGLGNYTWSFNPSDDLSGDGSYEFTLTLWDKSRQSFSKSFTVMLDSKAPELSFTSPAPNESFESAPSAKVSYSDDGVGVKERLYKLYNDAGQEITIPNDAITNGSSTSSINLASLEQEGSFRITAQVEDYLGHKSDLLERTFYYDKGKPSLEESSIGESTVSTNKDSVTLSGIVYDSNALYKNGDEGTVKISGTWNGKERSVNAILTKKSESVAGKTYTDKQYAEWSYTFYTDKKSDVDKNAATYLPDGSYTFAILATDVAKKTTQISRTVKIDTVAPSLGTPEIKTESSEDSSGKAWYKTNELRLSGTAADEGGTGVSLVKYQVSDDGTNWTSPASNEFAGTTTWSGSVSGLVSKKTLVKIIVTDNAGNETESDVLGPFNIDSTEPELTEASVKVGSSASDAQTLESYYTNAETDIFISADVTDEEGGSGVKAVYVLPYKKLDESSLTDTNKKASLANGTFSYTIKKSDITKSGSIYARIVDYAGNYTDVNLVAITYDKTEPKIQSSVITDVSDGYLAYEGGKITKDGTDYRKCYVNNSSSHAFTVSGVATDNLGLSKVELSLDGAKMGGVSGPFEITDEDKLSNWTFTGLDLSGVDDGSPAEITVTDKAGNTVSEKIYISVDNVAPVAKHEYDAKKKDLYFRIGEFNNVSSELSAWNNSITDLDANLDKDVGGKYSAGTWGTASTITIRGYWGETGSGVKTIYYKIFNSTATTEDDLKQEIAEKAEDFAKNYATDNNGNFAPLKENITKRVAYNVSVDENGNTTKQEFKEVESTFKATIPGFNAEQNYLLLVAVDNVGNAAIDTLGASLTEGATGDSSADATAWNKGLSSFSLNVDTVAPTITSTTSGSQYTNGIAAVNVCLDSKGNATGTVSDSSSGVKSLVLTVEGIEDSVEATLSADESDSAVKKWSAQIPTALLSKLSDKNYNVNATAKDVAGNKSSSQIFTLQVDKEAPSVQMVSPAYSSGTATTVNGTISLRGTAKYDGATPNSLTLYYTTSEPDSNTKLTQIGEPITDVNSIFSWTVEGFNSYASFTDAEVAKNAPTKDIYLVPVIYDVAGNCSVYSEDAAGNKTYSYTAGTNYFKYTVDKNTDRPVIKLGNCDVSGTSLKSTSKAYGTIEDDDGLDGLKFFYISQADFASDSTKLPSMSGGTVTLNGWTQATVTSGSWEIDSGAEGNFAYYLYVIDAAGTPFYSKASSSLNQMYVYNGVNDKTSKANETAGISFSADLNPPEIESLEIAHEETPEKWSAVTETFGPGDKSLYIKLVVSEKIGLKENASPATDELKDRLVVPAVTIDGNAVSASLKSVSKAEDENTTKYTYFFNVIDLSSLGLSGANTLKVIVEDKSGFTGQGTIGLNYDNEAPTIKIISPTATISDAVIAATTIKGTAFDKFSAIKKLEYVIPKKNVTYSVTEGEWVTIGSTTSTWDIEFDSGSSESVSSLLYYAVNKETYDVEEVADGLGIYRVPFYFRTTDTAGNIAFHKADSDGTPYVVYVNPDGGNPSAWINAPETGITTSGTVTVYGGAMDNISVSKVCVQIDADGKGEITEADYNYIEANLDDFGLAAGSLVASTEKDGVKQNDWYILAEGTNSWKCPIKTGAIPDYAGSEKNITYTDNGVSKTFTLSKSDDSASSKNKYLIVQVRAIDGDGNTRKYTNANYVNISNTAPNFSNIKVVQFGSGVTAPSSSSGIVTEREYVSGMYLSNVSVASKGSWYLCGDVESPTEIGSIYCVPLESTTATILPLASDGSGEFLNTSTGVTKYVEKINETKYRLYIPLKTSESGMIYAMLKSGNKTSSVGDQTIKINIDSTAPTLYTTGGAETEDASTKDNGNLRIKSQQKILGTNLESNSVIENSDGYFQFGDTIKEAGSGLAWLAFYFENDIKGKVYDPMKDNSGTSLSSSKENGKLYINEDNFAALYLTGLARDSETKLTLPSANEHVRKGGLVKVAGTYHTITEVSDTIVTFTPAASTSFTEAEVIYAQVVDHSVTESIETTYDDNDVGSDSILDDDGDGMCESLTQQGSYYNWSAYVDSNKIPDGTTYIRVVAMDNAGNMSHGKIASMVANNRPRLTKVFIATDLNGNGKYDFDADQGEAPVVSTSNKLRTKSGTSFGEFNYYTAYNTKSGVAQSKVLLDSKSFKVISGLCVVPEFTGGNGSSLKYTLTNASGSSDLDKYTGGTLQDMIGPEAMMTGYINNKGSLPLFGNDKITNGDNNNAVAYGITDPDTGNSYKKFGGIVIPDSGDNADSVIYSKTDGDVKYVKVTFFDNTDNTDDTAHKDGQWATLVIPVTIKSSDSTVPEPKIAPFYWTSGTDNSVYIQESSETSAGIKGHIELEGDITSEMNGLTSLTSGAPKVSGKVKIEGTVYDDVRLSAISMSIFGSANATVATYSGSWKTADSLPTGVLSFVAEDEDMSQNGHTVKYTAVIDTETLSDNGYPVGKGKWITVGASDWKNNVYTIGDKVQTSESANTNCYQMDVVPYVTEIVTHLSAFYGTAHSVYARTARGHYPCYEGEEIEFKGYNLGSGKAKVVIPGMAAGGDALSEANKITLTATSTGKTGAVSGAISLSVNGIPAMNNINTNNACGSYTTEDTGRAYTDDNYAHCYNRQPNGVNNNTLTDDLELDVWQFKNAAKPVNGGAERVTMKINPVNGTPGFSYANSVLYFSMPGYSSDHVYEGWNNDEEVTAYNDTINGTYASQIPFGMNYGGFSHNSFTFDNKGYSYGAAMCTDTQNAKASAFFQFFSKEAPLLYHMYDQNMNYCNEANASRLDSSTVNVGTETSENWQCNINRIQSISMETSNSNGTNAATSDNPIYVFMAYYDAVMKQVRFRWGTVGANSDTIDGKYNQSEGFQTNRKNAFGLNDIVDEKWTGRAQFLRNNGGGRPESCDDSFVKYSNNNNGGIPIQVIAGSGLSYSGTHNSIYGKKDYTAGQYVSLSILGKDTASPTACVFWYDGSKLMMAYNSSPTTGKTWNYETVDTDGGLHVKSAVDSDGGIHLAYYTSNGGNLKYAYLSGVTANPQIATIDANGAVGTKCTIDVAKNADGKQVPYITYQMIGGVYTYNAKIAYRTNFDSSLTKVPSGADSKDMFTGDWEVSVIPTESSRLLNDDTINVGLWRDSSGNAKAFTSNAYWKASDKWFDKSTSAILGTVSGEDAATGVSKAVMDVGNPSLIYGNNTANPIVGYGIDSGAIEMAQKK